ncbi:MAG: hypothetical protein LBH59_10800 [Planctomycetaceae bacterium]|nr:hypothetical protein [Planctomycetaceae bacterium]
MSKRSTLLRLPCSALRILKRLQQYIISPKNKPICPASPKPKNQNYSNKR